MDTNQNGELVETIFSPELQFYLDVNEALLLSLQSYIKKKPFQINLKEMITQSIQEESKETVVSIQKLKSIDQIPESIEDYAVTNDIREDIGFFVSKTEFDYYLVNTTDPHRSYISKTRNGKKLVKSKEVFGLLETSYKTYFSKMNEAMSLVMGAEMLLEKDIKEQYLTLKNLKQINNFLEVSKNQLVEAENALGIVCEITPHYHREGLDVNNGFERLKEIKEYKESVETRIQELDPILIEKVREPKFISRGPNYPGYLPNYLR